MAERAAPRLSRHLGAAECAVQLEREAPRAPSSTMLVAQLHQSKPRCNEGAQEDEGEQRRRQGSILSPHLQRGIQVACIKASQRNTSIVQTGRASGVAPIAFLELVAPIAAAAAAVTVVVAVLPAATPLLATVSVASSAPLLERALHTAAAVAVVAVIVLAPTPLAAHL